MKSNQTGHAKISPHLCLARAATSSRYPGVTYPGIRAYTHYYYYYYHHHHHLSKRRSY